MTQPPPRVPDPRAGALQRAREAQHAKLIRDIDPDGTLAATDPDELARRIADRRRARYADMARASHKSRKANRVRREIAAQRDQLVEVIGRLMSLPPNAVAEAYGVDYTGEVKP